MKHMIYLIASVLVIINTSCSKEESVGELLFELYFYHDSVDEKFIGVMFSSDFSDEYPVIEINGILMEHMYSDKGITGTLEVYPYSEIVNYKITHKGKSQSGSILMPSIDDVKCNDIDLIPDETIEFEVSDNYEFRWDSENCNIYRFNASTMDTTIYEYISAPNFSINYLEFFNDQVYSFDDYIWQINIKGKNGVLEGPGAKPNDEGIIGKGYISSERNYTFNLHFNL